MIKILLVPAAILAFVYHASPQNCGNTSTGAPPINDLGQAFYNGMQGGLYPAGSNARPAVHNSAGVQIASEIRPLDQQGNPNAAGKIVWISIGMSNTTMETQAFKALADTFRYRNPRLFLVDGAVGGQEIDSILNPNGRYWDVVGNRLQGSGATAQQVQVIWFKQARRNYLNDSIFPAHAYMLREKFRSAMQLLKAKFPNARLCYLSSRIYGGYSESGGGRPSEPYAYQQGWGVKWIIENQINGDTSLTYSGPHPRAPWMSWGPYLWADGTNPRLDGLAWICPGDFEPDGIHPSTTGRRKVADMLFRFFTSDETATPWFLSNQTDVRESGEFLPSFQLFQNFPNPFNPGTMISYQIPRMSHVTLIVFDVLGREVATLVDEVQEEGLKSVNWAAGSTASGLYVYRLQTQYGRISKRMLLMR